MSHSTDPDRPAAASPDDQGFALVEIIVALAVTMTLVLALVPQLIGVIRSAHLANVISEAKGVGQAELETVRALPLRESWSASDVGKDLQGVYYPTLALASACDDAVLPVESSEGYVAEDVPASQRCGYEPQAGAFYRVVKRPEDSPFTVVVDTQFLDWVGTSTPVPGTAVSAPLSPTAEYTLGRYAVSRRLGVTVTVLYRHASEVKTVRSYTEVTPAVVE